MTSVFISYVKENKNVVEELCEKLESSGINVWLDRNVILPGSYWKDAIRKSIKNGDYFIACFSKEYNERKKTYMNKEVLLAIEELQQLGPSEPWFIPVLLSDCEIPDWEIGPGITLRDLHCVKLYENFDKEFERLLSSILPDLKKNKSINRSVIQSATAINDINRLLNPNKLLEHIETLQSKQVHKHTYYKLQSATQEQISTLIENRSDLSRINSRQFKGLVSELLKADGYEVNLVPRYNVPEQDIIAYCSNPSGLKQKFIVECKKWNERIGIETINGFINTIENTMSTGGILVTTSNFTSEARHTVEKLHKWRVQLIDSSYLLEWIKKCICAEKEILLPYVELNNEIMLILKNGEGKGLSLHPAISQPCQRCGGEILCGYIDLGVHDYYDNYFHLCTGCLENFHIEKYVQYEDEGEAICPLCKRTWEGQNVEPSDYIARYLSGYKKSYK